MKDVGSLFSRLAINPLGKGCLVVIKIFFLQIPSLAWVITEWVLTGRLVGVRLGGCSWVVECDGLGWVKVVPVLEGGLDGVPGMQA